MGGTTHDMVEFVRNAYDGVGEAYLEARRHHEHDFGPLDEMTATLRRGARVLDVGCGPGVPIARRLASAGFTVIGVDLSEVQIALARENVPGAEFSVRDMTDLRAGEFEVDAVVAFYSLIHAPRTEHLRILTTLRTFLPHEGRLLCTFGSSEWEGEEPFFGVPMRWSHYGPDESQRLAAEAGFAIDSADIVEHEFDGETERHLVVAATAR